MGSSSGLSRMVAATIILGLTFGAITRLHAESTATPKPQTASPSPSIKKTGTAASCEDFSGIYKTQLNMILTSLNQLKTVIEKSSSEETLNTSTKQALELAKSLNLKAKDALEGFDDLAIADMLSTTKELQAQLQSGIRESKDKRFYDLINQVNENRSLLNKLETMMRTEMATDAQAPSQK